MVLSVLYFPFMEFAQLFIVSHVADVNDIISGYGGVLVGVMLYYLLRPIRRRTYRVDLDLLKIPLLLYGVYLVFAGLQPFDWSLAADVVGRNLQAEHLAPFYAYYQNTSLWNMHDLIGSLMSFVPLSLYWACCWRAQERPWASIYIMTILAGLAWGVVSEGIQLFSASRVADLTDVLAYGSGGALGTLAKYYHERQSQLPRLNDYSRETILA
jgi:VanZ family protein